MRELKKQTDTGPHKKQTDAGTQKTDSCRNSKNRLMRELKIQTPAGTQKQTAAGTQKTDSNGNFKNRLGREALNRLKCELKKKD